MKKITTLLCIICLTLSFNTAFSQVDVSITPANVCDGSSTVTVYIVAGQNFTNIASIEGTVRWTPAANFTNPVVDLNDLHPDFMANGVNASAFNTTTFAAFGGITFGIPLTGSPVTIPAGDTLFSLTLDVAMGVTGNTPISVNGDFIALTATVSGMSTPVTGDTQNIFVGGSGGSDPLGISCPSNVTATSTDGNPVSAPSSIAPTPSNYCGNTSITYSTNPDIGSGNDDASSLQFPVGMTTVTYTITDTDDPMMTEDCSFTVTVDQMTPPTGDMSFSIEDITLDCNDNSVLVCVTVENFIDVLGASGTFEFDDTVLDFNTASNFHPNVMAQNFDATDFTNPAINGGVSSDATVTFSYSNFGASASIPDNDTIFCLSFDILGDPGDNSLIDLNGDATPFDILVEPIPTIVNPMTAQGNIIIEADTENPMIACPNNVVMASTDGNPVVVNTIPPSSFSDNCGSVVVSYVTNNPSVPGGMDDISGTAFPVGTTVVTYTATDGANNSNGCSFNVTINGPAGPNASITVEDEAIDCAATTFTVAITAENFIDVAGLSGTLGWDDAILDLNTISGIHPNLAAAGFDISDFTFPNTLMVDGVATFSWTNFSSQVTVNDNDTLFFLNFDLLNPLTTATNITLGSMSNGVSTSFDITTLSGGIPNLTTLADTQGTISLSPDLDSPIALCQDLTVQLDASGNASVMVSDIDNGSTDNCGIQSMVLDVSDFDCTNLGSNNVILTVTDDSGNIARCTSVVMVEDNIDPVANCQDITIMLDAAGNATITAADIDDGSSDNCGSINRSLSQSTFDCSDVGTNLVTITITDDSNNSNGCTATVTVLDNMAPQAVCQNITIPLDATGNATITAADVDGGSTDNCTTSLSIDVSSFDCSNIGDNTVTLTVMTASNEMASCTATVTVEDLIGPDISDCPSNISSPCEPIVSWTPPTATDACGGMVTTTSTHNPGDSFSAGTTTVTYTFTDQFNNQTTCSFDVIVSSAGDPLELIGCMDITESQGASACNGTVVWDEPVATGGCSNIMITSTHSPGDLFFLGTTTVTYTATDDNGGMTTCSFDVTIEDLTPPVISDCPMNFDNISVDAGMCSAVVNWTEPSVTDNCNGTSATDPVVTSTHNSGDAFPVGTTTVTYTATDASGNPATCSFTITVIDNEAPVLDNCPMDLTTDTDPGMCTAVVSWTEPNFSDNCMGATISSSHNSGDAFPIGTTTVTYNGMDAAGAMVSCSFTVTVSDNEDPVLSNCPMNINQSTDAGNCTAVVNWTPPSPSDNCMGATLTSTHNPGDVFQIGITTVTYTLTDASNNIASCSFDVLVGDLEDPVINNCPTDITAGVDLGNCDAVVNWTAPTVTDNCMGAILISSHNSGDVFPLGTTTVTYTARDASGNTVMCSFDVTIDDDENPVLADCPMDIITNVNSGTCSAIVSWTLPTISDNCPGVSITSSNDPGDSFPVGTTTVTYTVTDASGKSTVCTFDVTVIDDEDPVISNCPMDITTNVDPSNCAGTVSWTLPTITDNCPGVNVVSSNNPGDNFPIGTTTVTYTATDAAGNTVNCSFDVTVIDPSPTIDCPSDIMMDADMTTCNAIVNWTVPTPMDNCPGAMISGTHEPGDEFPVGTTTVTYTVTDAAGNTADCSFNVIINGNQGLTITGCPSDISQGTDTDVCTAVINWTEPTASSSCSPVTISGTHEPDDEFPIGTTTVTYTAQDTFGNMETCSFDVTVLDNMAPVFTTCPTDITQNIDAGNCSAVVTWTTPVATDNCGNVSLSSNQDSGDTFPVGTTTITYLATDDAGNTETCSFTVTVVDNENPVLSNCPTDITEDINTDNCEAMVIWQTPSFTDNCTGVTLSSTHNSGDLFPLGTTTVTYTATDANGNNATCSFDITVEIGDGPSFTNCPTDITQNTDAGTCSAIVNWVPPAAVSTCSNFTVSNTHSPGDVFPLGQTTVTYTVVNDEGQSVTCSFTVNVVDMEAPILSGCPTDITVAADAGTCIASVNWTPPTVSDNNCPSSNLSATHSPGDEFPTGVTTVTYTGIDAAGNTATCSFTVTVTDDDNPTFANCPSDITQGTDANMCSSTVIWAAPTASDNCTNNLTVLSTHNPGDVFPLGTTTVTYSVTDANGNSASCSFDVTIVDDANPEITCPMDITIMVSSGTTSTPVTGLTPTSVSDNCGVASITNDYNNTADASDTYPTGTTVVTYTVTDAAGNTSDCAFNVNVVASNDTLIVDCPGDISANTDAGVCTTTIDNIAPSVFSPGGNVTSISYVLSDASTGAGMDDASNEIFQLGTTTVTYTVTNDAGRTAMCSFNITVSDNEAPIINNCPSDIITGVDPGECGAVISWTEPTASDNCDNNLTLVSSETNGSLFDVGVKFVNYSVTDAAGNTSICTFVVTVLDNQAPAFTNCPTTDISVPTTPGECGAFVDFDLPTAVDDCGTPLTTCSHNPGELFPIGTTTVSCTATDDEGNMTTCSFDIIVTDNGGPILDNCPMDLTVSNDAGQCGAIVSWTTPTVNDDCSTVTLDCTHNPGEFFPVGSTQVTCTATDSGGNAASCSFIVTVEDTENPVYSSCPDDITVPIEVGTCGAIVTWDAPICSDNCGVDLSLNNFSPGDVFPVGSTVVSYACRDFEGNLVVCTFTVNVIDTQSPTITNCPDDITLSADAGLCEKTVSWIPPSLTDNCMNVTLDCSHEPGDVFPVGTTTVTCSATDLGGNSAICTFDVTITDDEAPVIVDCPGNIVQSVDPGTCQAVVNWTIPSSTDNCGVLSFISTIAPGTVFDIGTSEVTYVAVDAAGNSSSCTFTVTVADADAPTFSSCPSDSTLSVDPGSCGAVFTWTEPTVSDLCDMNTTVIASHSSGSFFPTGVTTVSYTATDGSGNTSTCSFTVTVNDDEAPTINCLADIEVSVDGTILSGPNDITLVPTDDCDQIQINFNNPVGMDNCPGVITMQSDNTGLTTGSVFPVGTTTLSYTAVDAAGNSTTCSFDITVSGVSTEVEILINPGDTVCAGTDVQLFSLTDGSAYLWTGPNGFTSIEKNPLITNASGLNSGTYTIQVTISDNCVAVGDTTLFVSEVPNFAIESTPGDNILCSDGSDDLTLDIFGPDAQGMTQRPDSVNWVLADGSTSQDNPLNFSNVTTAQSGVYTAEAWFNGCSITLSKTIVITLNPENPTVIRECDEAICLGQSCVLRGPQYNGNEVSYSWSAVPAAGAGIVQGLNDNAIVITPTEPGMYVYTYTAQVDGCFVTDSEIVFVEGEPEAMDDIFTVPFDEPLNGFDVLENDSINTSGEVSLTVLNTVANGTLVNNGDGTFDYTPNEGFFGADRFVYEVCYTNCNNTFCSIAMVTLRIEDTSCNIPNLITPNNDGFNDQLEIPCLDVLNFPQNEIIIFNQWGDEVFKAAPYNNDWDGTYKGQDLPDGTYYYYFKLNQNDEVRTGYITVFR